jgi:FkbM family methyltransferase
MEKKALFEQLILTLPDIKDRHARGSSIYELLALVANQEVISRFLTTENKERYFGPFGYIVFPYHKMGSIDSIDLFGLDELIIFSFYWKNRNNYQHVVDIGANIGLHSLVLSRCGFKVISYEPDPIHFELLMNNLNINKCDKIEARQAAVSKSDGEAEFIRVLGNTTGSHLSGAKENPYGDLDKFTVKIESIKSSIEWADFIKIDAEGHENEILSATKPQHWDHCDAIVEVGSEKNAIAIFELFNEYGVNLFAQKLNWERVCNIEEMPISYKEGSLFISRKDNMPW